MVGYVVSLNLHRRHLDESQRAVVAGKIATLQKGANQHSPIGESVTQAEAAGMLNVGKRTVERAREVLDHGTPNLVRAVERGDVAVSAAAQLTNLEPAEQDAIVALPEPERSQASELVSSAASRFAAVATRGAWKRSAARRVSK